MDAKNQYMCFIASYIMSFLSKSYQIILDRAFDTTGHGRYVVDVFNAVQKRYLATCSIMPSTPEVYQIDNRRMRIDAMTEKGEVRFSEECKRLLDLCNETGC